MLRYTKVNRGIEAEIPSQLAEGELFISYSGDIYYGDENSTPVLFMDNKTHKEIQDHLSEYRGFVLKYEEFVELMKQELKTTNDYAKALTDRIQTNSEKITDLENMDTTLGTSINQNTQNINTLTNTLDRHIAESTRKSEELKEGIISNTDLINKNYEDLSLAIKVLKQAVDDSKIDKDIEQKLLNELDKIRKNQIEFLILNDLQNKTTPTDMGYFYDLFTDTEKIAKSTNVQIGGGTLTLIDKQSPGMIEYQPLDLGFISDRVTYYQQRDPKYSIEVAGDSNNSNSISIKRGQVVMEVTK